MEDTLDLLAEYGSPQSVNATAYTTYLNTTFSSLSPLVSHEYPLSAFNHTPFPAFYALTTIATAYEYKCPAYRGLTRAFEKGVPAWTYLFARTPSCPWTIPIASDPQAVKVLGATHTAEIPYVFANTGALPLPDGECNFSSAERDISTFLVNAWSGMAENGTPNGGANSSIFWPSFDPKTNLGVNVNGSVVPGHVDYSACALFDRIEEMMYNASVGENGGSAGANFSGGDGNSTGGGGGVASGTGAGGKGGLTPTSVASFTGDARGSVGNLVGVIALAIAVVGFEIL